MKRKADLHTSLRSVISSHGWGEKSIEGLPTVFAREGSVTAYFRFTNSPKRPFGDLVVEGVIGAIHRNFERQWLHRTEAKENRLACGMHLANFRELHERLYIPIEGAFEDAVENFCLTTVGILNKMPSNEAELVDAHAAGLMCGLPFSAFAIY